MSDEKNSIFEKLIMHPHIDRSGSDASKYVCMVIFYVLTFLLSTLILIVNLFLFDYTVSLPAAVIAFISFACLVSLRLFAHITFHQYLAVIYVTGVAGYLFYFGVVGGSGHVWVFIAPLLFFILLGLRKGLIAVIILLMILLAYIIVPDKTAFYHYNSQFLLRYYIAICYITLFAFSMEFFKHKARQERDAYIIKQQKQLHEKEMLIKEIHHRVKNNFMAIKSLLALQQVALPENDRAAETLQVAENRILTMAAIHEKLYKTRDLKSINIAEYIKGLSDTLIETYSISETKVLVELNIPVIYLDISYVIPMGLILNELITNALKYAFPGERKGVITIDIQRSVNTIHLSIKDTGIGLPDNFSINSQNTLGMVLVMTFVDQLNGTLDYSSESGTCFTVSFNVSDVYE